MANEVKTPIPARLYNAAVGGHVCGSVDIIDDDLGLEQNAINKEVAGAVPYNQANPNGMGRIVLKKNDNFKQVVEAQTDGNTIFVIKYDFTLTGDVTIPANCVLEFDGGSVSGGNTLTGNNTRIIADDYQIFGTGLIIAGSWIVRHITDKWFYNGNNILNNVLALNNSTIETTIEITKDITVYPTYFGGFLINSNTSMFITGTITKGGTEKVCSILGVENAKNVYIEGGILIGNKDSLEVPTGEYGHGIYVVGGRNVNINNVTVQDCNGDGIDFYGYDNDGTIIPSYGCSVRNCIVKDCGRDGIGGGCAEKLIVENCEISGIKTHAPSTGMDFEKHDSASYFKGITIRNCKITDCVSGVSLANSSGGLNDISDIVIDNLHLEITNTNGCGIVMSNNTKNTIIKNCYINVETSDSYSITANNTRFENNEIVINKFMGISSCEFINNKITSSERFIQVLNNIKLINNNIVCAGNFSANARGVYDIENNTILCMEMALGDNNYTIENCKIIGNVITCESAYYPIGASALLKHLVFKENRISSTITGEAYRSHIYFGNIEDSEISDNVFDLQSNHSAIEVEAGTNVKVDGNVFNKPADYTATLIKGICVKTATSNRAGDMIFDSNKPIWWTGSAWVDATGATV